MNNIVQNLMLFVVLCSSTLEVTGNNDDKNHTRRGNRLYEDSLFVKAEVEYRKAIDKNPNLKETTYNLGNALIMQQKADEALKQYINAASLIKVNERNIAENEDERKDLAYIYHNMGVVLQGSKQLDQCIEAYKKALKNNPTDHETRYNLALAMKQKKEQDQQQNQDKNNDQQNQKQNQEQDQHEQQQNQQKQQENQNQTTNSNDQNNEAVNPVNQNQPKGMSKENAEQMLRAVMQDEKEIQEKIKKELKEIQPRKFDKDW